MTMKATASDVAAALVDQAIEAAREANECYLRDPAAALRFAIGFTSRERGWSGEGWPKVIAAAREGDPVAVELVCRLAELGGGVS